MSKHKLPEDEWTLIDTNRDNTRSFPTEAEAREKRDDIISLGAHPEDLEIRGPGDDVEDRGDEEVGVDVVEHTDDAEEVQEMIEGHDGPTPVAAKERLQGAADDALAELGESLETDPLEILPAYMIDTVKGTPTLNKRGLSVLAFHYGVSIEEREIIVSPHESEWEYAIVETTVTNQDGNRFVGTGTAHVDRGDDREILLELAETRSYKRAVSFGTGTGIVSYQELTGELE